ncbi:hypothetical protein Syun_005283 [Stephania yunnanensis]|uniref:EF-hand domain-containing protein n=1 Tax=Stephania yunnanensis TaxID=152371 RepID=A0AAP0Q5S3_9MAGN
MASTSDRADKVKKIFEKFDVNRDRGLNSEEMAALVMAANPRIKFNDYQIEAILNEIFRVYGDFMDGEKGLTCQGLLKTYDDGAGDVDRDLIALGLDDPNHNSVSYQESSSPIENKTSVKLEKKSKFETLLDNTGEMVDELEISINRLESKQRKDGKLKEVSIQTVSDPIWLRELEPFSDNLEKKTIWEESGRDYALFSNELAVLRNRADGANSRKVAIDEHMAIGRLLYDHQLIKDALVSFTKATQLERTEPQSHFWAGNCLYLLGRYRESEEEYSWALEIAEVGGNKWDHLLPQIHINLGIVNECQDRFSAAYNHYREAITHCPTHFRALKLMGGALRRDGNHRLAEKALEEAINAKPDYADAHCELGLVLHAMGETDKAMQQYQKAIDLTPGHVNATYNLGNLFMELGKYRMASAMYARVLDVWPNNWRAQINRAVVLFTSATGQDEEARKAMKEAFKTIANNKVEPNEVTTHIKQVQERASSSGHDRRFKAVVDETMKAYCKFIEGQRWILGKCINPSFLVDDDEVVVNVVVAAQAASAKPVKRAKQ